MSTKVFGDIRTAQDRLYGYKTLSPKVALILFVALFLISLLGN